MEDASIRQEQYVSRDTIRRLVVISRGRNRERRACRIVEGHSGRIEVESTPGEDSTFLVDIPIGQDEGHLREDTVIDDDDAVTLLK